MDQYLPAAGKAERDEMNKLLLKINAPALLSQASQLRGGVTCSIPRSLKYDPETRDKVMGGMNYHLEIQFGDGVIWIVRIRRSNAASPPSELQSYILQSEVATLKFLSNINIPTPQVYHYETDENNPVGVPYILMEKMPGTNIGSSLSMTWSPENRRKVLSQLADIYIQLLKHPVDKMGSFDHPGIQHVGPFAVESLTDRRGKEMRKTGPCSSIQEYYKSGINLTLDLILRQEIYTSRPVDAYLVHRYLLDMVARVFSFNDLDDGNFYLRHADDKGDHILVDEDFNITGIIDWEWAYTAPKSIAFNSPIALLPVREFYDGINRLGDDELIFAQLMEEKGHPDLGEITRTGRLLHRFDFCCGYDISDWDGFLGLFFGLVNGLSEDLTRKFGDDQHHNWEIWKTEAMEKYWRDERLQKLIQATNFF
ncbi:hypothetical protein N7493_007981 [Penicillium malachiteum]|uniref:Aminoglycoside phosphotransferase domain-containing protein n=1 Tax=Penicillium malachiteum TaxID=1324776 RepID=A0AAD6HGA3_9EURO|nr:hypothetical protein N7493_007981 [Penicillium malachiteum]